MHVEFAPDGAIGFDDANDDDRNVFARLKFALQLFESGWRSGLTGLVFGRVVYQVVVYEKWAL